MNQEVSRTWAMIVYPESAPENWRELIEDLHIKAWVESPLHDSDLTAEGEPKKAHYHVILLFDSIKSYKQVLNITESLNTVIPQRCLSLEGTVRYMIHADNPDKFQYNRDDIVVHGNIDISKFFIMGAERLKILDEIAEFIIENDIKEYMDLKAYALKERPEWNVMMHSSCYEINQLIRSRRHADRRPMNPLTGEMY